MFAFEWYACHCCCKMLLTYQIDVILASLAQEQMTGIRVYSVDDTFRLCIVFHLSVRFRHTCNLGD